MMEARTQARWVPFVLAVFAVIVRWVVLKNTHSTTEDFLITLRYAENLAAGRGFVYNPGEHVLGTTTPLYTLLLALAAKLGADPALFGKSLNILAEGATVWLICRTADKLGHPRAGWIAALLYTFTSAPISISIGGMETGLVTCAGMAVILAFVERRAVPFAVASALLFLLRIDGILLPIILSIACPLSKPRDVPPDEGRRNWRALAVFLCLTVPWIVFASLYFGSPLPASMLAKLAVYSRGRAGVLPNLPDFHTQFASGPIQWALLALFLAGTVLAWKHAKPLRGALIWLAAYYGVMLASRVPAFAWYFLPPLPVYYLCVGFGLIAIVSALLPKANDRVVLASLGIVALALCLRIPSIQRDIASAQRLEDEVRRPLGEWLRSTSDSKDTVMLEPIGYIGYYSGLRVIDSIGLVSPQVIPSYRPEVENPLGNIVEKFAPDWLVLRPMEREALDRSAGAPREGSTLLRGEYRWARSFPDGVVVPSFEVYQRAKR